MRILHLVSTLNTGSGVMNVLMNYARQLKENHIYFDFLYFQESKDDFRSEIENIGGRCYLFDKPKMGLKYKKYLKKLLNELQLKEKYKIFHIHEVYLTFMFAKISKAVGFEHILTHSHATSFSDKLISSFRNRMLCIGIKQKATNYLSCSIAAGKFLYGDKAYEKGHVKVVTNAINLDKYQFNESLRRQYRQELNYQDYEIVIGHIGRFNKQKNHKYLIDLFDKLQTNHENYRLLLVGDGPLLEKTKALVKSKKLQDKITFLGNKKNANEYLNTMDLFVMPSLFEGLPLVGVEAQANGLSVIFSTNITKEIIFKGSYYLNLKDRDTWIQKLVETKPNANRRISGIENITTNGYEIKTEAAKLERFYRLLGV